MKTSTVLKITVLCAAMTAAAAPAQAGWFADLMCNDSNDPALCRSHLPDWARDATVPTYSPTASATFRQAMKLEGDAKTAFIVRNSAVLGGPKTSPK